ncbi:hypothetical protein GX51_00212 [Blastomyces parvus]|uniref:Uncharacterized protein n=1 Tax=Blastomyces parvus TaxID=2060905 RepID=A0A2B7XNT2_9EURO|nr:hypothetical protein GX51_00212 [Blastomyces parvus]
MASAGAFPSFRVVWSGFKPTRRGPILVRVRGSKSQRPGFVLESQLLPKLLTVGEVRAPRYDDGVRIECPRIRRVRLSNASFQFDQPCCQVAAAQSLLPIGARALVLAQLLSTWPRLEESLTGNLLAPTRPDYALDAATSAEQIK